MGEMSLGGEIMQTRDEWITVSFPAQGDSMAIVVSLCRRELLRFDVLPARTKQHLREKMENAAIRKIAAHSRMRDALVIATKLECPIYFVRGSRIRVSRGGYVIGLNSDPDRVVETILDSTQLVRRIEHV